MSVLRRSWRIASAILIVALTLAARSAEGHRASPASSLVGTWRFVQRTERLADGTTRRHPVSLGYLIYTDVRRMCYVAVDPTTPTWRSARAPTPDEAVRTLAGLQAYCSRVDVNTAEGYVIRHVELGKVPNVNGHDRKRWFAFDGPDTLRLRVEESELQTPVVGEELVWERVRE